MPAEEGRPRGELTGMICGNGGLHPPGFIVE
jgi:hypothetical protein